MAKKDFRVTEDKSTVQNLVDYNSNVLLPYTILDAITEYSTNGSDSPVFGLEVIYKNTLDALKNRTMNVNSADGTEYYPIMYNKNAHEKGSYLDGLCIGPGAYKPRRINDDEYEFLSQDGTFVEPPRYTFDTSTHAGSNVGGKKMIAFTNSEPPGETRTWMLHFGYDGDHFTDNYNGENIFGSAGSLYNFLHGIDSSIDPIGQNSEGIGGDSIHNTYNPVDTTYLSYRYIPLFYKYDNQGSGSNRNVTTCEMREVLKLTTGYAIDLKSRKHDIMTDSDTSIGIIDQGNTNKFVVYQEGEQTTKFLRFPEGVFGQSNENENIALVVTPGGVLKWDSAGIQMNKEEDNNVHYILGTSSNYSASKRAHSMSFSDRTYFKGGSIFQSSDERLKKFLPTNISLQDILNIKVSKFVWKSDLDKENPTTHFGVSAQSVEDVVPEMVNTSSDGYKSVEYDKLGALSIYGIQMLIQEVNDLKKELAEVKEQLNNR